MMVVVYLCVSLGYYVCLQLVPEEVDYLLKGKRKPSDGGNPLSEWLPDSNWEAVTALKDIEVFQSLPNDMVGSAKRWREWMESEKPENEKLPQDWKNKSAMQRLCILRALRPDRMTVAMATFVAESIGSEFVEALPNVLSETMQETSPTTPILFVLSPGVDPVKELEALGRKMGYTEDTKKYRNVSLGQGQEPIADRAIDDMFSQGGWVMLQNIHLTKKWLPTLEKKMESIQEEFDKGDLERLADAQSFRLFLTAEPNADPSIANVQPGIVQVRPWSVLRFVCLSALVRVGGEGGIVRCTDRCVVDDG